jgi:hypothetical protein
MIWHIFKKDARLLWPLAVGVASVHFLFEAALLELGHFGDGTLASLMSFIFIIAFLGSGFLIAAAVHLDAIPGAREDWLARPVKRRDLLLAKLLFAVVAVEAPIFAADLMQCLANGFPISESLGASGSRSVYLFAGFCLPILALASLTKSFMETMAGGIAASFGVAGFIVLAERSQRYNIILPTGAGWTAESACLAVALIGAIAVLGLQYFRRKTTPAIWLAGTAGLLCLLTGFIPWQVAFAIQQRHAASPGTGSSIGIAFDPMSEKSDPGQLGRPGKASRDGSGRGGRLADTVFVDLPLRIAGLPDDAVLSADRSEARLIGADGGAEILGPANRLEIRSEGQSVDRRARQGIPVDGAVYSRFKSQPVRLEIDYSLTLFRLADSYAIPALGGNQRTPDAGWCMTEINEARTYVRLNCLKPGKLPSYATVLLEHTASGRRNPEQAFGHADYSPYFGQYLCDAISRFGADLPFRDPSGLARYPVDGAQLPDSQVVLKVYQPRDHFTRRLVIPDVRLQDWGSGLGI